MLYILVVTLKMGRKKYNCRFTKGNILLQINKLCVKVPRDKIKKIYRHIYNEK